MMRTSCFLLIIYLLAGCSRRSADSLSADEPFGMYAPFGTGQTFELATWNIRNFPAAADTTIGCVQAIIEGTDVDLIAVQEISSVESFNALLAGLDGWSGVLSADTYNGSYQKTGLLYKTSFISLSSVHNIFTEDESAFPRPPLTAFIEIKDHSGTVFDFNIIVLHLKAMTSEVDEARRRMACEMLQSFISEEIAAGADPDFIVLGDWNDVLDDPPAENVFTAFLNRPEHYTFLTRDNGQESYISEKYHSLIDHILVTNDIQAELGSGRAEVLYPDSETEFYLSRVSDHRPVAVLFNGFSLDF